MKGPSLVNRDVVKYLKSERKRLANAQYKKKRKLASSPKVKKQRKLMRDSNEIANKILWLEFQIHLTWYSYLGEDAPKFTKNFRKLDTAGKPLLKYIRSVQKYVNEIINKHEVDNNEKEIPSQD